ncbi:BnaCnng56420D [Brassica napus]|uniref:BnaCnng56420D protein n=1 Tax=Brassica napus TaxID=3708 RepID=A0A078JMY7_BRANA|nr:BnaCnng56420D [Brassica napus]
MDSEIVYDFSPVFIIYKSGRIERLTGETIVQSSLTPHNGVVSKDVVYSPGDNLSVRIFLPEKAAKTGEKLPLLQCRWITGVHRSIPFRSLTMIHGRLSNGYSPTSPVVDRRIG